MSWLNYDYYYLQGFMVSALLSPAGVSVCFSFEKQHITSSSCDGCPGKVWCSHLIAAMIHRIVYADQVNRCLISLALLQRAVAQLVEG